MPYVPQATGVGTSVFHYPGHSVSAHLPWSPIAATVSYRRGLQLFLVQVLFGLVFALSSPGQPLCWVLHPCLAHEPSRPPLCPGHLNELMSSAWPGKQPWDHCKGACRPLQSPWRWLWWCLPPLSLHHSHQALVSMSSHHSQAWVFLKNHLRLHASCLAGTGWKSCNSPEQLAIDVLWHPAWQLGEDIAEGVVVCPYKELLALQVVLEFVSHSPLQSQELQFVCWIVPFTLEKGPAGIGHWMFNTTVFLVESCSQSMQAGISVQDEWKRVVRISKHWWICQFFNDSIESVLAFLGPGPRCCLCRFLVASFCSFLPFLASVTMSDHESLQRSGDLCIVLDKASVVAGHSRECMEFLCVLWHRPSPQGFCHFRVCLYPIGTDNMSEWHPVTLPKA